MAFEEIGLQQGLLRPARARVLVVLLVSGLGFRLGEAGHGCKLDVGAGDGEEGAGSVEWHGRTDRGVYGCRQEMVGVRRSVQGDARYKSGFGGGLLDVGRAARWWMGSQKSVELGAPFGVVVIARG
ncbi:CASP-like protein 4U1 isoform X1 [Iris pallida]|uniref:CASP-like protein 4U1 isoform X1 n=1 Tax=Iris pallida TaxID=29817 RepID=A0AAX6FG19_IRIPA|nr:CASP-like protein 4U1 isoform X1 [Iris pallida]